MKRKLVPLRSLLFVPGDSEKKLARSERAGCDALILDLEDSVDAARKSLARGLVAEFLADHGVRPFSIWVRVNDIRGDECRKDLAAIMPARPHGIVLPKSESADDVAALGNWLVEMERESGIEPGATKILPIATETPASVFGLASYARCRARLAALTWGAEDLSVAVGGSAPVDDAGNWLPPYELVRSLCLFAAATAEVPAIDTVYTKLGDTDGLMRQARAAMRDGFVGKLAIHPSQVEILNEAFVPDAAAIAEARRVVAAFGGSPGVVSLDGRMLDRPHLLRAQRILDLTEGLTAREQPAD
jgi:citrate lyase subunit beta/citryl-CoA lyase